MVSRSSLKPPHPQPHWRYLNRNKGAIFQHQRRLGQLVDSKQLSASARTSRVRTAYRAVFHRTCIVHSARESVTRPDCFSLVVFRSLVGTVCRFIFPFASASASASALLACMYLFCCQGATRRDGLGDSPGELPRETASNLLRALARYFPRP
jgi:hypothetical protein